MTPPAKHSFSRFIYLDTGILSHLVKNRGLWSEMLEYCRSHDLTVAFSEANAAELSEAKSLHSALTAFLMSVPSGVTKGWETILTEEVQAHPDPRNQSLLSYALNALLLQEHGPSEFEKFIASDELREARSDQISHARQMSSRLSELRDNFPPSAGGRYSRQQADEFAQGQVLQWLASTHPKFLAEFRTDARRLHPEVFRSIRLYAYVVFYKYYLGRREPSRLSDFADLAHLFTIPYCRIAIMERDLSETLRQIKLHQDVLDSTQISNIDFFGDWDNSAD